MMLEHQDRMADDKATKAETAWQDYDFGDGDVSDAEGWDRIDPLDHTRITYVSPDNEDADSFRVSFHVRFNEQGHVVEVYALDMVSGGYIGTDPIVRVPIGSDGRIFEVDTRRLSKDSGFVALTIEINGGTQYALTTDVMDAMKRVKEAGGKVVDASTDFEELINSQYDGFAVLTTEMS